MSQPHPERRFETVDEEKHKQILRDVADNYKEFILIYEHEAGDGSKYWNVASNIRRDEAVQVLADVAITLGIMIRDK